MRILYWLPLFLPDIGGVEILSAGLLPELSLGGHQVEVITAHGVHNVADETTFQGIPIHRLHFRAALRKGNLALLAATLRRVSEIKKTFRPEVYHLHVTDPSGFFHLRTLKAHAAPSVVTLQVPVEVIQQVEAGTMINELLENAAWFTTVSKATYAGWLEAFPGLSDRASLVYNAVEIPQLQPLPLSFDPARLLCIGRLISEKRFDVAIQALGLLSERFPSLSLTIAGDGYMREQLEQLAGSLQLEARVQFVGEVAHGRIPELLNSSTLFLMPSASEGLPLTPLEAASMSRPVVASAVGGIPEVVLDGKTGMLVPPGEAPALAEVIAHLLEHPPLAQEMGIAGRKLVEAGFSMESIVSSYENIYQGVVDGYAR